MEDETMTDNMTTYSVARRGMLRLLGMAVAGTALGTTSSSSVFAKQFTGEATVLNLPPMVYDPALQMMVDPQTRQPIYDDPKNLAQKNNPTVTSGCKDCPKCDDYCQ